MNSLRYDDHDDDELDMRLEFEVDSEDEQTDDEDDGEIGECDDTDNTDDGETTEDEEERLRAWMYEPLPRGQPGENRGDAEPPADPNRLLDVSTW